MFSSLSYSYARVNQTGNIYYALGHLGICFHSFKWRKRMTYFKDKAGFNSYLRLILDSELHLPYKVFWGKHTLNWQDVSVFVGYITIHMQTSSQHSKQKCSGCLLDTWNVAKVQSWFSVPALNLYCRVSSCGVFYSTGIQLFISCHSFQWGISMQQLL